MHTLEVYKKDGRTQSGERLVLKQDYDTRDRDQLKHTAADTWPQSQGYRCEIHETVQTRKTIFGDEYRERYDTPRSCSPSSELFWSQ